MNDKELVQDLLNKILDAAQKVIKRFTPIQIIVLLLVKIE
ncbi:MAG: hypothetical protein BMS9Abin39_0681 [Ignavibacteria bacterium]|nr:MAG: hypothetical protein BMS9Abin39_0681 [Ignavibacteria bacterium]